MILRLIYCLLFLSLSHSAWSENIRECVSAQKAKRAGQLDKSIEHYQKCIDEGDLSVKYKSLAYNNMGNSYLDMNLFNHAIEKFDQAIEINPKYAKPYNNRGIAYEEKGLYHQAVRDYTKSIELNPDYLNAYNSLAWIKATCPIPELRNGQESIQLATKVNENTDWKETLYLDTLAAAHAEDGDFSQAVKYQKMAIDLMDSGNSSTLVERLNLYKQNKPYRDVKNGGSDI